MAVLYERDGVCRVYPLVDFESRNYIWSSRPSATLKTQRFICFIQSIPVIVLYTKQNAFHPSLKQTNCAD